MQLEVLKTYEAGGFFTVGGKDERAKESRFE